MQGRGDLHGLDGAAERAGEGPGDDLLQALLDLPVPTIAAVDGYACQPAALLLIGRPPSMPLDRYLVII